MPWTIVYSSRFKKRYKKKPTKAQNVVDDAIKELVKSDDPRTLGRRKHGAIRTCYGHDMDQENRILYSVNLTEGKLYFLRVCSHKEVYQRL